MSTKANPLQELMHRHFGYDVPAGLDSFLKEYDCIKETESNTTDTPRWLDHLQRCQQIAKIGSWEGLLGNDVYDIIPVYWSDEFFRILGYKPGELPADINIYLQAVHPEDVKLVQYAYSAAAASKCGTFNVEHRIVTSDGTIKIVWHRGRISFNNGKPVKIVGTTQDITNIKQKDEELKRSAQRLTVIFEHMSEVFFTVKMPENVTTYISKGCTKVYGYTPEEFMADPGLWFKVIIEEDKAAVLKNAEVLAKGEMLEHRYRIRHKNGSLRWIHSKIHPTLHNGSLVYLDGFAVDVTEQTETANTLRASEYRFRSLIQNNTDAIKILNKHCEIIFASDSLFKVMGYRPSEVIGKRSYDHVYKEDREKIKTFFAQCLSAPGKSLNIRYRRVKKDGEVIWCEGTAVNLLHVPEVAGVILNFRDVTKRVYAEKALRASELRFRSLIQHNSDGIVVIDPDSVVQFASESFLNMVGCTEKDLLNQCSYQFIHQHDIERLKLHHQRIVENPGKTFRIVYRRLQNDGTYLWLEGTGTNMLHVPEINGIILNIRNITEKIEADQAIQNSERKLSALIAHSSDAITITNPSLDLVFASDSWHRMTGYGRLDDFRDFDEVHPEDRSAMREFLQDLFRHPGKTGTISFRLRRKDGEYIWLERVAVNMMNDPAIKGIISNFRDITQHRLHTEALTATNIHLKKANMELDKFVYRVSHDLRAPLLSILGLIQLAEQEEMSNILAEYVKLMKSSVEKLDLFIQEILDYSRNARTDIKHECFNLRQCVEDLVDQLRFVKLGCDTIRFENMIPHDMMIISDKIRVSVIVNNLVSNAIRYADTAIANPYVVIKAEIINDCLQVSIEDNGIGIPEVHQSKIFDMFYRASERSQGSGMGLYIVKETVEKLHGKISFSSAPGKGTAFTFCLPCTASLATCKQPKLNTNA